ncbi:MAG: amidohydrolase family protein [Planctomycetota bacterium]
MSRPDRLSRRVSTPAPLLMALALAAAAPAARADDVALVDVTVHPVTGPTLERATVLIKGGKVRAVGKVEVPPGVKTLDLRGKHLYPALIDADTVLGLTEIGSVKGSEDTREVGKINPNLRAEVGINPDSRLFPVTRTGGVLLAHIAERGGLISGTSAVIATQGWTYEDMTLRAPVFLHVRWPRMRVERRGRTKEQVEEALKAREEALATIKAAFREGRAYAKARRAPGSTREVDPKWEAMLDVLAPAGGRPLRVAVHAETLAQIQAALDWARAERLEIVLVGGADAWRVARKLKYQDVPVIIGPQYELPRRRHEDVDTFFHNAERLHEAGVRIAFSTGGDGFLAANARHLRLHAAHAVGYGLPHDAALHALTLGAAEILGIDGRVGSIEVGKDATLIVTDKDILDDAAKVTHAWIGGDAVNLRDKQLELYERYKARPKH